MTEFGVLTEVNLWVGVGIALVATFYAAPEGTRTLLRSMVDWGKSVEHAVVRRLPFRRHKTTAVTAIATAGAFGAVVVTAEVRVWPTSGTVDEKIGALHKWITDLDGKLNTIRQQLQKETVERSSADTDVESRLRSEVAELRARLAETERVAASIDARALPVIGVGILLSGVPDRLAALHWWHIAWMFPIIGVGVAVNLAVTHHRGARGQRTGDA